MDTGILDEAGLSKRETEIYLALLRAGSSLVSRIAKDTGLHRSNIYDVLEQLQEKGLVSFVVRNNIKYYKAEPAERILRYLEERSERVKQALPELKRIQNSQKEETEVKVFKGKEGYKTVLNEMLKDGKDYLWFGGCQEINEVFPLELIQFLKKAEKIEIKGKMLEREDAKFPVGKNEIVRLISKEFISLSSNAVWGNKTAIFIATPPFHIILIENKEIADSNRKVFEFLWKMAKKPGKDSKTFNV